MLLIIGALIVGGCGPEPASAEDAEWQPYTSFVKACLRARGVESLGDFRVYLFSTGELGATSSQGSIRGAPWFSSSQGLSDAEMSDVVDNCLDTLQARVGVDPVIPESVPVPAAAESFTDCMVGAGREVEDVAAYVDADGALTIEAEGRGSPATAEADTGAEALCYETLPRSFGFLQP